MAIPLNLFTISRARGEPPEDLESRMRRQRVKHVKEMEKAVKPKTLDARGGIKPAN